MTFGRLNVVLWFLACLFPCKIGGYSDGYDVDDLQPIYLESIEYSRVNAYIPSSWAQYQLGDPPVLTVDAAVKWCNDNDDCSSFSLEQPEDKSQGREVFFFSAAPSLDSVSEDAAWWTYIKNPQQHRLCCHSAWSLDTLPYMRPVEHLATEMQRAGLTDPNLLLQSRGQPAHFADDRVPGDEVTMQAALATALRDTWPRTPCNLTRRQFVDSYLAPRLPGMFLHCEEGWAAMEAWAPENLPRLAAPESLWRAELANVRAHEMDNRYADLMEAIVGNGTGYRAYVFDTLARHPQVLEHFTAPKMFIQDDLYDWAARLGVEVDASTHSGQVPSGYGPLRWLSFGARSTGTVLHVDPVSSDDWNTLLFGAKHWLFWEPGTYERYAFYGECDSLCSSFLPEDTGRSWQVTGGDAFYYGGGMRQLRFNRHPKLPPPHEILQKPGETIYIPAGWMHGVFNYGAVTLAVTMGHGDAVNLVRDPWVLDWVWQAWEEQPTNPALCSLMHRVYHGGWLDRDGRAAIRNGTALSPEMRSEERTQLYLEHFVRKKPSGFQ